MSSIGTAYVEVKGDYSGLTKGAKKGISPALKIASGALVAGLGVALKGAVSEAREAAKVGKQTAAVIKSTGGVANVSAKEIDKLSNALSNKAGVDDELIQSGANLLLTFKNIRNEQGKNNDIFNRSQGVITDLTATLNHGKITQDGLKSSTLQLGKALSNPVKGINALNRAGVDFTQQQKDQIKTMAESGDLLGAQKMILKEVESQTRGSAEANADSFDRFQTGVANIQETIGAALLPVLGDGATAVSDFFDEMQSGKGTGGEFVGFLDGVVDRIEPIKDSVLEIVSAVGTGFEAPKTDLGPFSNIPTPDNRDIVEKLKGAISGGITQAITELNPQMLAEKFLEVVLKIINTAMDPVFLAKHIVDLIGIALTFSKVGFLRKIPILGPALGKLGDFIWDAGKVILKSVFGKLGSLSIGAIKAGLAKLPVEVGVVLVAGAKKLTSFQASWTRMGTTLGEKAGNAIVAGVRWAGSRLLSAGRWLMGKLWGGVTAVFSRLVNVGKDAGDRIRDGVASLWARFYKLGGFLLEKITKGMVNAPLDGLKALGGRIGKAIQGGIGKLKATVGIGGGLPVVGKLGNDKGGLGKVGALAASFGNSVTSGYRPGDPGWHGKNRARDYAGGNMMGFARAVAAKFGGGLLELIHTPLGFGIKNGRKVPNSFFGPAVMADHYDHVHVAMRRGGKAGPGLGGPSVVYGEGKKTEWWVSQEGNREKNIGYAMEALQALTGKRLAMFRNGGKKMGASVFSDAQGYKEDNLHAKWNSYAELSKNPGARDFSAMGGLPYLTPRWVTGPNGRTLKLYKRDVGAGGGAVNGYRRAIDLTTKAARLLGVNGLATVTVSKTKPTEKARKKSGGAFKSPLFGPVQKGAGPGDDRGGFEGGKMVGGGFGASTPRAGMGGGLGASSGVGAMLPTPDPAEDPAVALAAEIAANTAALQEARAVEAEKLRFAQSVHTANKSVTDTTLNAILDRSLGGQLSQMLLTLSPRMAT